MTRAHASDELPLHLTPQPDFRAATASSTRDGVLVQLIWDDPVSACEGAAGQRVVWWRIENQTVLTVMQLADHADIFGAQDGVVQTTSEPRVRLLFNESLQEERRVRVCAVNLREQGPWSTPISLCPHHLLRTPLHRHTLRYRPQSEQPPSDAAGGQVGEVWSRERIQRERAALQAAMREKEAAVLELQSQAACTDIC